MSNLRSFPVIQAMATAFLDLRTIDQLAELLHTPTLQLLHFAAQPNYHTFHVPKKNGKFRLIEDPNDTLQTVQDALNDFLQAVYYLHRTPAAYGFVLVPDSDKQPRQIEQNAAAHLGCNYLLNADLRDFFHQVTVKKVTETFTQAPFHFEPDLTDLLTKLTTYQGRCPMGAPTSPVLSNFAFRAVDLQLLTLASEKRWSYTRYADDLSFSSEAVLQITDFKQIERVVNAHDFTFNHDKLVIYGPGDDKLITGLKLGYHKVELPDSFVPETLEDIKHLQGALVIEWRTRGGMSAKTTRFVRSMEGKIAFAERILGANDGHVKSMRKALRQALQTPKTLQARNWLEFGYF